MFSVEKRKHRYPHVHSTGASDHHRVKSKKQAQAQPQSRKTTTKTITTTRTAAPLTQKQPERLTPFSTDPLPPQKNPIASAPTYPQD